MTDNDTLELIELSDDEVQFVAGGDGSHADPNGG